MLFGKGTFKDVYVVRFMPGEDVMESLEKFVIEHGIGHGAVLSGIGSLLGCSYLDPVVLGEGKYGYTDPIELPAPIELISMQGIICSQSDGKPSLHVHASFADATGNGYAGHFKTGNIVMATVEVVIVSFDHICMKRDFDEEQGIPVFEPSTF